VRVLIVLSVIGRLLRLFSLAFVPPLILALLDGDHHEALNFAIALGAALAVGTILSYLGYRRKPIFHRSEALAVVAGTWLVVAQMGAVPYLLEGLSPVDAVFESMSGFTTTGATILTEFDRYGRAFFLWRGMTNWFGGLGVIALFVVVLPSLGIAGRQLFFAEASTASEAVSPQIHRNAQRLWVLYVALTLAQTACLVVAGMPLYDSLVNSFGTLAAGGFSPNPRSIAGYGNPAAEWVFVVFMILGGTSFTLQYKAITGRPLAFFRDGEFLFYFGVTAAGALAVSLCLGGLGVDELRVGFFQSASLISSTGFASVDYNLWGDAAKAILIVVMLVGGCAGSAAGGAKAVRHLIVLKLLWRELKQVMHPYGVVPLRYGERLIPLPILRAVVTLVALYILGYILTGVAVVISGTDLVTGFTAALACLGNIGPGFGGVGPMENYAWLSGGGKVILTLAMWIGRLEIVTVLALLHPDVWKRIRLWDARSERAGGRSP
jgi:trk system potassium uptake protein TrkH